MSALQNENFRCILRAATLDDFDFAEALTRTNMHVYYQRHGLVWRGDLFLASWRLSENFIVERDQVPIGVLRISDDGDALHIRDVQLAPTVRGEGCGTFLLETVRRWAQSRRRPMLRLRVFTDNPAARLYVRLGYKTVGGRLAEFGMIKQMERSV
jgi:GNAT superfamily N-acetyltransferase